MISVKQTHSLIGLFVSRKCAKKIDKGNCLRMNYNRLFLFFTLAFAFIACNNQDQNLNEGIVKEEFGQLDDGRTVHQFTLTNENDIEIKIINYGGIITSLKTPDRDGNLDNVVLGFDNLEDYQNDNPYFGALIGRYGNRIERGAFELNGTEFQLTINDGENHLHGGEQGFDSVFWNAEIIDDSSLQLSYVSSDGEEGYPGNLQVTVTYRLTDDNDLRIDFEATTDQATPVNLTAHSYFNLTGDPSKDILDHQLLLHAGNFTPVNSQLIPTGEIASVENTPFDFTDLHTIGSRISEVEGGYDHNFVLDKEGAEETIAAELVDEQSGRKLTVLTTEPGIQFYSGNFLDGSLVNENGIQLEQYSGLCLEPQHFPNSPNEPEFPSTILQPGETFSSAIVYRFSVE